MKEKEAIINFNEWLDRASEFRKTQSNDYKPDHVLAMELAVKALEEIQQYRSLGTLEELKKLKEKSVPKEMDGDYCPICRHRFSWTDAYNYCPVCGQKMKSNFILE